MHPVYARDTVASIKDRSSNVKRLHLAACWTKSDKLLAPNCERCARASGPQLQVRPKPARRPRSQGAFDAIITNAGFTQLCLDVYGALGYSLAVLSVPEGWQSLVECT